MNPKRKEFLNQQAEQKRKDIEKLKRSINHAEWVGVLLEKYLQQLEVLEHQLIDCGVIPVIPDH